MRSKTARDEARGRLRPGLARLPLAAAIHFAVCSTAFAQAAADEDRAPALESISVTAQKREEDVQKVPISMQVLDTYKLREMNVSDFDDFARLLPTVSFEQFQPGFSQVYMRGVASGSNGNHSGPLPSVGMYLDEQPITTIQGALDLHVYDIARVESLAGPQGTLYGASSQAGTIRIITNKPDPSAFAAGYGLEANTVSNGGNGYVAEGFVNAPVNDHTAIRLVGWSKHDAGYIDNVFGSRTFPTSGITIDNAGRAEKDYNDVDTTGARAALLFEFDNGWTVNPTVMGQRQDVNGTFAGEDGVGDYALTHFYPEKSEDRWVQAALTVQGKIGNFDVTYAGAHLSRDVDIDQDYNDYSFWYDTLAGYGAYFYDDDGVLINPAQYIQGTDRYTKMSHELRIASPSDERLRVVAGVFWQEQNHEIQQRYIVDDLADSISVTGWPDTIWLTKQYRQDDDRALFGEVSYDFTDKLTLTGGARFFKADNSLKGFFGYSAGFSSGTGEAACFDQTDFRGAPCVNLDKNTKEDDGLGKLNLTYQIDDDRMIYATWSEGYRPGGINRRGSLPPYKSDFLTNYEFGWKMLFGDRRFQFNGAVFQEEWKDFQFALLGQNGLTEIKNANQAEIRGLEVDMSWAATYNFTLSGGVAFYDSELTENYCGFVDDNGNPETDCADPEAPSGTQLPITAKFKGNLTGRYVFDFNGFDSYFQGTLMHEGKRKSDLRLLERDILGDLGSYELLDLSAGFGKDNWKVELYVKNVTDEAGELFRYAQCAETVCGEQTYTVRTQPRTIGVRFSQEF
ncbi:MAG: TonB-dependent receptor [Xanthomonadales bacterium]|nr:TonB-dependent receptor [Xanthomonadales bacterium]